MRLMRCRGDLDSNSRFRSSVGLVGLRPMDIMMRCTPGWTSVRVRNHTMYGWVTGKAWALMFEKTPRMVCLPDAGSMWTPSQVIQARREGLDCTRRRMCGGWGAAIPFPFCHEARDPDLGSKPRRIRQTGDGFGGQRRSLPPFSCVCGERGFYP